jgi:hypothetical protein
MYIVTMPQNQPESVEQVGVQVPEKPPELEAIDLPSIGVDEMNPPTSEFSEPTTVALAISDEIGTAFGKTNVNGDQQLLGSEGAEASGATPGSTGGGSTGGGSTGTNPHNRDTDGDTISDNLDRCPREPETFNGLDDADGCPDSSPPADSDNDTITDSTDNCPSVSNSNQLDTDNDGMGNACDADDDNDTVTDAIDACPLEPENFNGYEDTDGCPDVVTRIPDISISNVTLAEGDSGAKDFDFTVTRSGDIAGTSSIDFATADGTATVANSDYASNSGTVNFAAGETTKTLTVVVNGDAAVEPDETFFINLSNCANCTISDDQGLGTIQNDDIAPKVPDISINDVSRNEGNLRTTSFVFSVSRSGNLAGTSSIDFATADGTATSPIDYDSASGTISFAAGETTRTLTIFVNGDAAVEPDETFYVNLSDCVGCSILDSEGAGSILNDDFPPAPDPCDGVDNNANGIVDEGEVGVDDNGDGTMDEPGDGCPIVIPDTCDGLDNNHNGIIDEGVVGVDDDGDGVTDEPGEACPLPLVDTDGDGVPDGQDLCPTLAGAPEDGGCPVR